MMKVKTSELSGMLLDFAVAKASMSFQPEVWLAPHQFLRDWDAGKHDYVGVWGRCGGLIEKYGIAVQPEDDDTWSAYIRKNLFNADGSDCFMTGPNPRVAAVRCFVAAKLGGEVEIPDELLK